MSDAARIAAIAASKGQGVRYKEEGPGQAINSQVPKDPMAAIIYRIAQLKGFKKLQADSSSTDYEIMELEKLLNRGQGMSEGLPRNETQQSGNQQPQQQRTGGGKSMRTPQMAPPLVQESPYREKDPYEEVRKAAAQAALSYLQTPNPHLISSLGVDKKYKI